MISSPSFVGIGAPKCGTTYLADILRGHPSVVLPFSDSGKELNFFTSRYNNWHRGVSWYLSQFNCKGTPRCAGEISPSYFSDPASPARIQGEFPCVRLLAILRDPVHRAYSSFLHDKRACRMPARLPFADALDVEHKYIEDSQFSAHLQRYYDLFPPERIHVLLLEDLTTHPSETLARLSAFLDLGSTKNLTAPPRPSNGGWAPRSHRLQYAALTFARRASHSKLRHIVAIARRMGAQHLLRTLNSRAADALPPSVYAEVAPRFAEECHRLRNLLQREHLPWRCANASS